MIARTPVRSTAAADASDSARVAPGNLSIHRCLPASAARTMSADRRSISQPTLTIIDGWVVDGLVEIL